MRYRAFIVLLLLCLTEFKPRTAVAQQADSPVQFSGTSRVYGQTSNRRGTGQYLPPSYIRWDLNSTLSVYGIPITLTTLLTSEQKDARQQLNYFSIGLNQNSLQQQIRDKLDEKIQRLETLKSDMEARGKTTVMDSLRKVSSGQSLNDPDDLSSLDKLKELQSLSPADFQDRMDELQSLGLATASQAWTSLFPTFSIGTNFTYYTPLTLSGMPITGLDVEFTPSPLYFAFTTGGVQSARLGTESRLGLSSLETALTTSGYDRRITAGRAGIGKKEDSHLFLTFLYGKDDASSRTPDTTGTITPQENYVLGTSMQLLLFDDQLSLKGEAAVSSVINNLDDIVLESPSGIGHLFDKDPSRTIGHAFSGEAAYRIEETGTRISTEIRHIEAGFESFGTPYLRKDYLRYEGKIEQGFFSRQMSVSAYYRYDEDNLSSTKEAETSMKAFGATLGLNFRNLPYLRLSYAPLTQQSEYLSDSLNVKTETTVISAIAGYTVASPSGLMSSTFFSFYFQEGQTLSGIGEYTTRSYTLSETVNFSVPLSLSGTLSYFLNQVEFNKTDLFGMELSGTHLLFSSWQNTLGISHANGDTKRTSFYLSSTFPVWELGNLSLKIERTIYDDKRDSSQSYKEVLGTISLVKNW